MLSSRIANAATVLIALCAVAMTVNHFVGTGANVAESRRGTQEPAPVERWNAHAGPGHSRGSPAARVTIVEYGDYECPVCGQVAPKIKELLSQFPNDVRLVYRHWPLTYHRFAYPAARAAECAGEQGRFWEMHDLLYERQDSLGLLSFDELATRAAVPRLDAFSQCNRHQDPVAAVERDLKLARLAGGTGTPTLLVNGLRVPTRSVDSAYVAKLLSKLSR